MDIQAQQNKHSTTERHSTGALVFLFGSSFCLRVWPEAKGEVTIHNGVWAPQWCHVYTNNLHRQIESFTGCSKNLFRWKQEVGLLQEINELTHKIGAISQMFDSKFQHRSSPCSSHLGFKKLVKAPLTFSANFYTVVIERREASKRWLDPVFKRPFIFDDRRPDMEVLQPFV